jgi:hypothetical protein
MLIEFQGNDATYSENASPSNPLKLYQTISLMEVFKSQVVYSFRSMIICQVSARKYQCRVQVITDSFLQRLRNSIKLR